MQYDELPDKEILEQTIAKHNAKDSINSSGAGTTSTSPGAAAAATNTGHQTGATADDMNNNSDGGTCIVEKNK